MERFDAKKNPIKERKNKMKKLILTTLVAASCVLLSQQAHAFAGTVTMGGHVSNVKGATTTAVTFASDWTVLSGDGAYTAAGISHPAVAYTNFSFNNTTGATGPTFTLWTFVDGVNTYTFDLDSPVTIGQNTGSNFQISGNGTGYINGLDGTSGAWSITGTKSGVAFNFTASSVSVFVPDGGSAVALLGIALAGIEGARRIFRARKA